MSEEAPQAWLAVAEAAQQARRGGMNELCERFDAGLQAMIDAFAELTTLAYRAGVGRDAVVPLHGRFFDGKVSASETFGAASILARVWCDQAGDSDGRSPVNESTQERPGQR